jgi:ParB/RepB/Spo0J family partition protein
MTIERINYEQVDISENTIDTTKAQARQSNINSNVIDLAATIELQGLFSPVLLVKLDEGKYELIAGQRRMKAHRDILFKKDPTKFGKIDAFIYRNNMKEWEKKSISINENFNQEPMSEEDKIASVTACYNEFNSIKITSKETGVPERLVSKYVKSIRLPKVLKKLQGDGKISLTTALETANIFDLDTPDIGSIPEDEIITSALELEKLTTKQKKRAKERVKKVPTEPPSKIIKEVGGKKETTHTITTEVASDSYARIEVFQQKDPKKYSSVGIAASELIDEGLDSQNI